MMGNFDFLQQDPKFKPLYDVASNAEKVLAIDPAICAMTCRKAMETAVKWMYSIDRDLHIPYQDNLITLLNTDEFKAIVDAKLQLRLEYIRRIGNTAAHAGPQSRKNVSQEQAVLALESLYMFLRFIAYSYSQIELPEEAFSAARISQPLKADTGTLEKQAAELAKAKAALEKKENELKAFQAKYAAAEAEATALRKEKAQGFHLPPETMSEADTRKAYIDVMLAEAGWVRGQNWVDEYPVDQMPSPTGYGAADYVLFG